MAGEGTPSPPVPATGAGHAIGFVCFEIAALAGAAGKLGWVAGWEALPLLLLAEGLGWAAARAGGSARGAWTRAAGARAARVAAVWALAGLFLEAFAGLNGIGVLLLLGLGGLPAAVGQWQVDALRAAPPRSGMRTVWWLSALAPVAVVLVPLAMLTALGEPLTPPLSVTLAFWGMLSAFAGARTLDGRLRPALTALAEGLRGLGPAAPPAARADASPEGLVLALRAAEGEAERKGDFGRAFGFVAAARPAGWLEFLEGPVRERWVVVLAVAWPRADRALEPLPPSERLAALGRFYGAAEEAVLRAGGFVLDRGGGLTLAVWGAPGSAVEGPVRGEVLAQVAQEAWTLRAGLEVLAAQHRLRHRAPLDWSLGLASGPAVAGGWGPRACRRFGAAGLPLDLARNLSSRPGGPWLDPETAAQVGSPWLACPNGDIFELKKI